MDIQGKSALVLGGNRGIGRAIARMLAAKGARLVLPWFDWPDDAASMREEFETLDRDHICLQADLRRPEAVEEMVSQIRRKIGRLEILINNIERGGMPVVHGAYTLKINRDQWQREQETTLHAKWLVFDRCLPLLRKAQQAAVINISSIAAITGRAGIAGLLFNDGYAAACRGVETLTRTWARLGAPNIRVNEVMLGIIDTRHGPGTRGWQTLTPDQRQQILDHTLLGRTGSPSEVAELVLFLLEKAEFMTGSTIVLDGGFRLGNEPVPPMPPGILEQEASDNDLIPQKDE